MPAGRARPKHFPEGTLLSFVALGINIVTTIFAVAFPDNLTARQVVYGLLLVFSFTFFASYLLIKHAFLACTWNAKPCCATYTEGRLMFYCLSFTSWGMIHDMAFSIMAILYLLGDNLEMACEERYCPAVAQTLTGTSLVLNIFLTLLKVSGMKLNLPSAYPVIGIMGHVYDKMLGIAATTLTIDQTVTTILQSVDIRIAAGTTNDTIVQGNTLIVDNIREAQYAASGIMTFMCGVVVLVVLIVLALLARANRAVCCHHKCSESEEVQNACKEVKWYERVFQWLCGLLVVVFAVLFLVGNTDWVYDFFRPSTVSQPSTIVRLTTLCASFAVLCILSMVYILVVCLPGVCFARKENIFFLPKHGNMTVSGHMERKRYNKWGNKDKKLPPEVSYIHDQEANKKGELKGNIKVEDYFGKTDIIVSIDELEGKKCCDGFYSWVHFFKQDTVLDAEKDWTVQMSICKGETDSMMAGNARSNLEEKASGESGPSPNGEGRGEESRHEDNSGSGLQPLNVESSINGTFGAEDNGGEAMENSTEM